MVSLLFLRHEFFSTEKTKDIKTIFHVTSPFKKEQCRLCGVDYVTVPRGNFAEYKVTRVYVLGCVCADLAQLRPV